MENGIRISDSSSKTSNYNTVNHHYFEKLNTSITKKKNDLSDYIFSFRIK